MISQKDFNDNAAVKDKLLLYCIGLYTIAVVCKYNNFDFLKFKDFTDK